MDAESAKGDAMVIGLVLLGIGLGLLAGELLAGALIGLGAGVTLNSLVAAVHDHHHQKVTHREPRG